MSRCCGFIQARMSSSRYPGKVLEELGGRPMIIFMVERVRRSKLLDDVVVVTSTDSSDDPLVETLEREAVPYFRGNLQNVLQRYTDAANAFDAAEVVRLTGDCPLIDPAVIDAVVNARRSQNADYASNIDPPTFPDGLDVECCTAEALFHAAKHATTALFREHVTLWMRDPSSAMRRVNISAPVDCSKLRLTVDYPDDLEAVRSVVRQMRSGAETFDLFDILRCVFEHPEITGLNHHPRNEGLAESLATSVVVG